MADPGIGVGAGGMIASLFNPGLASNVAQHITPNPNPLAQQGQPGDGTVDTLGNPTRPNLAQPAVTQPDPANAANVAKLANPPDPSYAADMMRYQRMGQLSDSLNHSIYGIAAGFGTAQQQAAKQAALRGDGTVGGGLGDLMNIQKMQEATTAENERARFMGNAQVFADSLSRALGRPVSLPEAQMIQNSPEMMKAVTGAVGSNIETTGTQKDADAATKAWAAANPTATEQQKADYKANLIAGGMGGSDLGQRQYLAERSAALAAGQKDFPDYPTWQADRATQAKVKQDLSMDRENATQALPDVNRQLSDVESKVDEIIKDPNLDSLMGKWTPNSGPLSLVTATEGQRALAQKISNLMSTDYSQGFKIGGASRKTQFELGQLSAALNGSLGSFNLSPADYRNGLVELKNKFRTSHANAYGETGDVSSMPSSLQGYLDSAYRQGGNLAGKGAPGALTQPSDDDKKDFAAIVSKYGRQAAVLHFREIGIDPSGL